MGLRIEIVVCLVLIIFFSFTEGSPPYSSADCKCGLENPHGSSSHGPNSSPLYYPWAVSIIDKSEVPFCGGVLISKTEVITAGRCVKGKSKDEIKLILGVHDLSKASSSDKFRVKKIISHPNFTKFPDNTYENNIALIVIEGNIPSVNNIQPICLLREKEAPFSEGNPSVLGWGQISITSTDKAQKLQMLSRPVIPIQNCSKIWGKKFDSEQLLCMGQNEHNICTGDEGGPLMLEDIQGYWTLLGITSFAGPTCGDKFPGVYTKISNYINFIKENSLDYAKCYK